MWTELLLVCLVSVAVKTEPIPPTLSWFLCTGPWGKNEFQGPSLPSLSWESKTEQQPSFYPTGSASCSSNTAQCSGGTGPSPTALETQKKKGRAPKGQPGHWDTLYPQLVHGVRVRVRGGVGVCVYMHQSCVHKRLKEGQKTPLPKSHRSSWPAGARAVTPPSAATEVGSQHHTC